MIDPELAAPDPVVAVPEPAADPQQAPPEPNWQAEAAQNGGVHEDALARYPEQIQTLARSLANYSIPLPTGSSLRSERGHPNDWLQAIQAAKEYDPTFDEKQYQARQKFLNDWTSSKPGSTGGTIVSGNKLINHLGLYDDAATQLNNSGGHLLSYPWNYVADRYAELSGGGDNPTTAANAMKDIRIATKNISDEKGRFYKGGAPDVNSVRGNESLMTPYESAGQQHEGVREELKFMGGQMKPLRDAYIKTMGKNPPRMIGDDERAVLTKMGVDPDEVEKGKFAGAARPDFLRQAQGAKENDIIPLPNGRKVKKLSDGTYLPVTP